MSNQFSTQLEFLPEKAVKELLARKNIKPTKSLGQNFLVKKSGVKKILDAAQLTTKDAVLEVGPGLGVLTTNLAKKANRVWAVEKDDDLIPLLEQQVAPYNNVKIIHDDILEFLSQEEQPQFQKVVSTPPYYLISPLLDLLLNLPQLQLTVLTVPRKQGERILAKPPQANRLSVITQLRAKVNKVAIIHRTAFWPQPEVDSLILKIKSGPQTINPELISLVKKSFAQPRKTILNNLDLNLIQDKKEIAQELKQNNVNPHKRPGEMSLGQWNAIFKSAQALKK